MAVVSHWPFDDGPGAGFDNLVVADAVGSNTGAISSTDAWSTTTYAGSYSINCGGTHHAEFSNEASFGPTSTRTIALSLFYHDVQGSRAAAFAPDCDTGGFEVCIGASLSNGAKIGVDVGKGGVAYQPLMGRTFNNSEWYRVVCVLKNGSAELWVNGELEDTVSYDATTNGATSSSALMSVGHETFDGSDYFAFNGIVDEVKTFDSSLDRAAIVSDAGAAYVSTLVDLSVSTSTIAENAGTSTVYATIDRTRLVDINVSLSFSGTATKDTDYSSSADSIVIAAGQTSGSITVTAINDVAVESGETIIVDISAIDHADENGTQQVTITIVDDDVAPSTLTIAAFCEDHNQMEEFQINQSSRPITFPMRHSATGMLVTGATVTTRLSKNGGAYAAAAGATGEMTLGSYSIAPNATDFNTGGSLKLIATAANCLTTYKEMVVVNHSPITGFPTGAVGAANGALVGSGTGTVVLTSGGATYSVDAAGVNIATASSIPTLSGIASTVAANVPTNAQIASTVAANVPTNAQIAATVAANLPTNASIASTVAAAVPTNASIASTVAAVVPTNTSIAATVAAAITADHGSGNYATATALAAAQSSINTLATTSQLASSSATLLAAIPSISTLATTSQLAESSAALLTQVNLAIATSAAILDDTGTSGVVVATASKTGYALASDGLDSISTTAPSGVATNFRQMVVQTWRRLFKKTTLTSTQLKTYADDGTTVVTTQAVTNSGGIETVGNAS